ncbi:hypothetical protein DASC09_003800 [Saccharomycopsis crataegensis]|uniref:Uncharacterized protein n=1 Tax=Saccharomycopsis crataegensis TaxID=43959 RepID=A0AAV5QDN7_9ASCO|nr:hypothetical protein DASC09_003800 [Saccharomycopsis crataegensis]
MVMSDFEKHLWEKAESRYMNEIDSICSPSAERWVATTPSSVIKKAAEFVDYIQTNKSISPPVAALFSTRIPEVRNKESILEFPELRADIDANPREQAMRMSYVIYERLHEKVLMHIAYTLNYELHQRAREVGRSVADVLEALVNEYEKDGFPFKVVQTLEFLESGIYEGTLEDAAERFEKRYMYLTPEEQKMMRWIMFYLLARDKYGLDELDH